MELGSVLLLMGAGLAAGFVAGLIGVGGGIIFAPVLFFYYEGIGVAADVIAPLTVGSSLLCTLLAAVASGWFQYRRGAVDLRIAASVGLCSAVAVFLLTRFVTTQPWYDGRVFQIVFSIVLIVVVGRMVLARRLPKQDPVKAVRERHRWPVLAATGTVGGAVAAAAGVGGGVVLVPAYHSLLRLPMHRAVGTSSATIVLISLIGVVSYAFARGVAPVPGLAAGYVDAGHALVLAVPAIVTARLGVWTAHRIDTRALRWSFAAIAAVVAVRLLIRAVA